MVYHSSSISPSTGANSPHESYSRRRTNSNSCCKRSDQDTTGRNLTYYDDFYVGWAPPHRGRGDRRRAALPRSHGPRSGCRGQDRRESERERDYCNNHPLVLLI